MFRPVYPILTALCAISLSACTVDESGNFVSSPSAGASSSAKPQISQAGTCFAFVTEEAGGTYSLTTGIGDGTATPAGEARTGLSAARVDALFASEREVMDISPECLAVLATDRMAARPLAVASATTAQ
jgi:hypothetical protein